MALSMRWVERRVGLRVVWLLLFSVGLLTGQATLPAVTAIRQTGTDPSNVSPGGFAGVLGTAFGSSARVAINGVSAVVLQSTNTAVSIQIPASLSAGPATLVVTTSAGGSAPFSFVLSPLSPSILNDPLVTPPTSYFTLSGYPQFTLNPGDFVEVPVNGLGPIAPPPTPVVLIDGSPVPALGMTTIPWNVFLLGGTLANMPAVQFQIPSNLPYGHHTLSVQAGGVTTTPTALDLFFVGLVVSPNGLTFKAVQGGPAPPAQTTNVLSGSGTFAFSISPSTTSGGGWLSASPQAGSVQQGFTGTSIKVTTNPSGLLAGTYYGTLEVSAPGIANAPQIVSVVLNVLPANTNIGAVLDSAGLIFVGQAGGTPPAAQNVTVYNPSAATLSFTSTLGGSSALSRFSFNPQSANIGSGQAAVLSIQAATGTLPAGAYAATITLSFSDGSSRVISLLLVVTSGPPGSSSGSSVGSGSLGSAPSATAAGCTPTKLLPVFTLPGSNFNVAAAWPTPIAATVVDDCGSALLTGNVHASFSNGDQPVALASLHNGAWTGTWSSGSGAASGITITVVASSASSNVSGVAQITGGVAANPTVPVLSPGGIVDLASYGGVVSPGSLIAIFGNNLAAEPNSAPSLPLPSQLANTALFIGGEAVPLIYTSDGQVNAMMPYDVSPDTAHPLIAQNGTALSAPQTVPVAAAHPAIFTVDQSGTGAGVIVDANNALITSSNPAQPGDEIVIYCTGLGAVTPAVPAGTAAPTSSLTYTVNTVTATIGGLPATVAFAGLTPGSAGLYQVNAIVPAGLPNNNATPVILTVATETSPAVTLAVGN